jgi:hypothetical protein
MGRNVFSGGTEGGIMLQTLNTFLINFQNGVGVRTGRKMEGMRVQQKEFISIALKQI